MEDGNLVEDATRDRSDGAGDGGGVLGHTVIHSST